MKLYSLILTFTPIRAFMPSSALRADEIASSEDFLTLTKSFQKNIHDSNDSKDSNAFSVNSQSSQDNLFEQETVMQQRLDEINHNLQNIISNCPITKDKLARPISFNPIMGMKDDDLIFHSWTNQELAFRKKNLLSNMDFMCIVNQIPYIEEDDILQKEAIINTLREERNILKSRMYVVHTIIKALQKPRVIYDDKSEQDIISLLSSFQENAIVRNISRQRKISGISPEALTV